LNANRFYKTKTPSELVDWGLDGGERGIRKPSLHRFNEVQLFQFSLDHLFFTTMPETHRHTPMRGPVERN
jgi:hypothetical protein